MKPFHHASAHLERAKNLVEIGTNESLLYAALELRYSLESRLLEYSEYTDRHSDRPHAEWSAKKTSKNIKETYGDEIEECSEYFMEISSPELPAPVIVSYRPVTDQIRKAIGKTDNYLHSLGLLQCVKSDGFETLKNLLIDGIKELEYCLSGGLKGPIARTDRGAISFTVDYDMHPEIASLLENKGHKVTLRPVKPMEK